MCPKARRSMMYGYTVYINQSSSLIHSFIRCCCWGWVSVVGRYSRWVRYMVDSMGGTERKRGRFERVPSDPYH